MARDNPYGAFNFVVTADSVRAGFQEVSGLSVEVTVAEYRNGNEPGNFTRKMNGLRKAGDVTLKRGVVAADDFFLWIRAVANGAQDATARRPVTIEMMDEANERPVMVWKLTNARPSKYTGPTLNAKGGTDVAMEELVLACEKIDVEFPG